MREWKKGEGEEGIEKGKSREMRGRKAGAGVVVGDGASSQTISLNQLLYKASFI